MTSPIAEQARAVAPVLTEQIDRLSERWLRGLLARLSTGKRFDFRPKQINDPVWHTIELMPWEVALLDTPLLQRLRGVRQLGLAQLVFMGANHGRLEHTIGVVGAVEEAMRALSRQVERWNRRCGPTEKIPDIDSPQRYAIRLASLLHDTGHGPFSHALEPVLERESPFLKEATDQDGWRRDLALLRALLQQQYSLNKVPSPSVAIAVMITLSVSMKSVFSSPQFTTEIGMQPEELIDVIVAAILGAVDGPGASHLSGLVSSQIDADRLDYLPRDTLHSGLEIGFDTHRLLAKIEILRVRADRLDDGQRELRERAERSTNGTFLQIGLSASGFGSFEQMLIGRTFLYDRLYHHHKVRAAEAMAQRLILVAERDRGKRFELDEIFLDVGDDTMLQILANKVTHEHLNAGSQATASLAMRLLERDLLHRAYAFRGRFIATPPGISPEQAEGVRNAAWPEVLKSLADLDQRYKVGLEIFHLALASCRALDHADVDRSAMKQMVGLLEAYGPEHIIVDVSESKSESIRILTRFPNGALKVPEFSFNPQKWADAYEIQKRTGYVFCPREIAPIIGLASKIVFLSKFGVVMAEEADGYIKAESPNSAWINGLVDCGIIDDLARNLLERKRHGLVRVTRTALNMPEGWLRADPDLDVRMAGEIQAFLKSGLMKDHIDSFGKTMGAIFSMIDTWYASDRCTKEVRNEAELQEFVLDSFRMKDLRVAEGSVIGGGKLDLLVEGAVLVENKFSPDGLSSKIENAAVQGRRYAIALNSQLVVVIDARKIIGDFPQKAQCWKISQICRSDQNMVEIRIALPYGAVLPSREQRAV
jgi:HD superfamily phosphohydrolase